MRRPVDRRPSRLTTRKLATPLPAAAKRARSAAHARLFSRREASSPLLRQLKILSFGTPPSRAIRRASA
jgi:hypothetical protein